MPTLLAITQSPWSERARWALDHYAVAYREGDLGQARRTYEDVLPRCAESVAGACTLAHLNALAAKHVAATQGVLVLVGDRKTVEAQWEGTGLPKPTVITREQALAGDLAR